MEAHPFPFVGPAPLLSLLLLSAACRPSGVPIPRDAGARLRQTRRSAVTHAVLFQMMTKASRQARSARGDEKLVDDERAELADQGRRSPRVPGVRVEPTARLRYADGEEAALDLRDGPLLGDRRRGPAGRRRTPEEALDSCAGCSRGAATPADARPLPGDARRDGERRPQLRRRADAARDASRRGDRGRGAGPGAGRPPGEAERESGVWRVEDFD